MCAPTHGAPRAMRNDHPLVQEGQSRYSYLVWDDTGELAGKARKKKQGSGVGD